MYITRSSKEFKKKFLRIYSKKFNHHHPCRAILLMNGRQGWWRKLVITFIISFVYIRNSSLTLKKWLSAFLLCNNFTIMQTITRKQLPVPQNQQASNRIRRENDSSWWSTVVNQLIYLCNFLYTYMYICTCTCTLYVNYLINNFENREIAARTCKTDFLALIHSQQNIKSVLSEDAWHHVRGIKRSPLSCLS